MTHKRNTEGLSRAAKQRRQETIKRVDSAIKQLLKDEKIINFNSISKIANVGKPWLYKEDTVRQQIENLREKNQVAVDDDQRKSATEGSSSKSKDHLIQMLKGRIHKLTVENKKLQEQIEALYGELYLKKEVIK